MQIRRTSLLRLIDNALRSLGLSCSRSPLSMLSSCGLAVPCPFQGILADSSALAPCKFSKIWDDGLPFEETLSCTRCEF
jgi:hypothetical protein